MQRGRSASEGAGAMVNERIHQLNESGSFRIYADPLLGATHSLRLHKTIDEREKGVVTALANIRTRVELGSSLTHQDIPGPNTLTRKFLHTEPLGVGIPPIPA